AFAADKQKRNKNIIKSFLSINYKGRNILRDCQLFFRIFVIFYHFRHYFRAREGSGKREAVAAREKLLPLLSLSKATVKATFPARI
ncbi:MAG: hypothetical protein LBU89_14540, partial [Fibromonadaceae bacterium]|nr:hypothetical protein [Fibromonadaceae bacterium]